MADALKLTKNSLRDEQVKLLQLQRYLPTLQLKKAMLQSQVNEVRQEIGHLEAAFAHEQEEAAHAAFLMEAPTSALPQDLVHITSIGKRYENVAGVEVPYYDGVTYESVSYSLIDTPPWLDALIAILKGLKESQCQVLIARERKAALEKELREVSIRVNLFEKIMIPRAQDNIRKIKVFLGDQQLAAVCQAKVAKAKIQAKATSA